MPKTPTVGWARWLVPVVSLLGLLPLRAEWKEGELRTVAYFAEGKAALQWWGDPLGDPGHGAKDRLPEPERVEQSPFASRFFREGDALWDVTAMMKEGTVFTSPDSQAVYNETTRRVVVRAGRGDHGRFEQLQRLVIEHSPRIVGTRVRVLKVDCAELALVRWNEELAEERGAEELLVVEATGRAGQATSVELEGRTVRGSLEVTQNVAEDDEPIDLKLAAFGEFELNEKRREFDLHTGLDLLNERPAYVELGSPDDPAHAVLLVITSTVQFMDGTPRSRWREFENADEQPPRFARRDYLTTSRKDLGDGTFLGTWVMPEVFIEDLARPEEEEAEDDPDPFADDSDWPEERKPMPFLPVVEKPDAAVGDAANDTLLDIAGIMRDLGVEIPDGGYVWWAPNSGLLLARLDAANFALLEKLCQMLLINPGAVIRAALSLIEWDGGDFEAGRKPPGARRLCRAGLTLRSGQSAILLLGREGEEGLEDGLTLDFEALAGADGKTLDLAYALQVRGAAELSFISQIAVQSGVPAVVKLGAADGKARALVIEAEHVWLGTPEPERRVSW